MRAMKQLLHISIDAMSVSELLYLRRKIKQETFVPCTTISENDKKKLKITVVLGKESDGAISQRFKRWSTCVCAPYS